MLQLNVKGKYGEFELKLPTSIDEIEKEYINHVTEHIKIAPNYTLVGIIYKEKLSTLVINSNRKKKDTNVAVIPVFVNCGPSDSGFINSLYIMDKLLIAPSDIMMGYHVSTPENLITINNILSLLEGDIETYNKLLTIKEECYFIEFKLIANCNIHAAYKAIDPAYTNPYITKLSDNKAIESSIIKPKSNIIL